ncbi:hypothetical protein PLICRDRAFT_145170 [Plicaturopsis crispa FD-325 SS-3]|nr:hypothetical protein PLICRDRAFT_145170 [Plicaturopsis crispa FD-325 SS-3]
MTDMANVLTHEDLPLELWLDIFRYATYTPNATSLSPVDPFVPLHPSYNAMGPNMPTIAMKTKCSLVLVCRAWKRVATEILYEYIPIRSPRRADMILTALNGIPLSTSPDQRTSEYGKWTRHISVHTGVRGADTFSFLQKVYYILRLCPNLRAFTGNWTRPLPIHFMAILVSKLGPSLHHLMWDEETFAAVSADTCVIATPEFFGMFRALRVLDLRKGVGCAMPARDQKIPRPELPHVEDLLVGSQPYRNLPVASTLQLPSLRRVVLEQRGTFWLVSELKDFIAAHGPRIRSLDVASGHLPRDSCRIDLSIFTDPDACPNLADLTFHVCTPAITPSAQPHTALRRIGLRGVDVDKLIHPRDKIRQHLAENHPSRNGHEYLETVLNLVDSAFPNLEVVRTVGWFADAESVTGKEIFYTWVDRYEKQGLDLQDGEGILWLFSDGSTDSESE